MCDEDQGLLRKNQCVSLLLPQCSWLGAIEMKTGIPFALLETFDWTGTAYILGWDWTRNGSTSFLVRKSPCKVKARVQLVLSFQLKTRDRTEHKEFTVEVSLMRHFLDVKLFYCAPNNIFVHLPDFIYSSASSTLFPKCKCASYPDKRTTSSPTVLRTPVLACGPLP